MFSSPLGTWLPLLSIFAATCLTGVFLEGPRREIPNGALTLLEPGDLWPLADRRRRPAMAT